MFKINKWARWNGVLILLGWVCQWLLFKLKFWTSKFRQIKHTSFFLFKFAWLEIFHRVKLTHFFKSWFFFISQRLGFASFKKAGSLKFLGFCLRLPSWSLSLSLIGIQNFFAKLQIWFRFLDSYLICNIFHLFKLSLNEVFLFFHTYIFHMWRRKLIHCRFKKFRCSCCSFQLNYFKINEDIVALLHICWCNWCLLFFFDGQLFAYDG